MPTDTPADRKALHAYLSTESHNAWHDTCAGEGVSVSGVLEVLGSRLEVLLTDELVREVRRLDAARRRRGPSQSQ
ncbi:MAG: hypothetical protein GY698_12600 [Actinomycetia bacterium]|nr:hypothetical protein [Actinomycetes bacterium]